MRVYYFCMFGSDKYDNSHKVQSYSGAAKNKVFGIVSALISSGQMTWIVSLPTVRSKTRRSLFLNFKKFKDLNVPCLFLPSSNNSVCRKILGLIGFMYFSIVHVKSSDKVILYNHNVEYILALIFLRLKGVQVFHDVEDVPSNEDTGFRGVINYISFFIVYRLTKSQKIVASKEIAARLGAVEYLPVYGVCSLVPPKNIAKSGFPSTTTLRILYSGTLKKTTGADILQDCINKLSKVKHCGDINLCFVICGLDVEKKFINYQLPLTNSWLTIESHPYLSETEYISVAKSCDVGLSLRLPSAAISQTTFPSKVIEYAALGLALISTDVSDVSKIFAKDEVFLLSDGTSDELMEIILKIVKDPGMIDVVSCAAQDRVLRLCSSDSVGEALRKFLNNV